MTDRNEEGRRTRASHLRWIPVAEMKVNPRAQRDFKEAQAEKYAADFDLEALGFPVVNLRDGSFYIVDGQHRVAALKMIGWGDQKIQCECYEGLTEAEEAELFLRRDERRAVSRFERFGIALTAERADQSDIDRIVRSNNLCISREKVPGAIGAIATLERVYRRGGPAVLGRTLRIIRDSFGDSGFETNVIDGIGLLCQRYNGQLDDKTAVDKLGKVSGGVNGLLGLAENTRRQTGNSKSHCVAATAVELINRGSARTQKLPSWWK